MLMETCSIGDWRTAMAQVMELVDGRWRRRRLTAFGNERELQALILADPGLVPGCAGAVAVDELPVPGVGSLDIALVDELGVLTLVECKLRANPQIRREVVGQILAYASGLRGLTIEDFADLWARGRGGGKGLFDDVSDAATAGFDDGAFRSGLGESLSSGSFRLVVAVDELTDELTSIIEYLSDHLDGDVKIMALEVGLIAEGELRLLVIQTYGQTFEPPQPISGPARKRWGRSEIDSAVAALPLQDEREFVALLLRHADTNAARFNGGVGQAPSAGFYYEVADKRPSLWSLFLRPTGATLSLNIGSVANASQAAGERYRAQANQTALEPVGQPAHSLKAYPEVAVATLLSKGVVAEDLTKMFDDIAGVATAEPGTSRDGEQGDTTASPGSMTDSGAPKKDLAAPAAFDRKILCGACGSLTSRVVLQAPSAPAESWSLIYQGVMAGNRDRGDAVSLEQAQQLTEAFGALPLTLERVALANLHDDAGFCSECAVPYCGVHWEGSHDGSGRCPRGHWKSLDPHWHPE
ncbi:hypothetical protein ACOCJ4_05660 [Knoellia sp. CPCC 206435]|uniref:hypothetical protein n=1 Tax=Knoellia terrae TaxID=3404797 RepID=UPI003B42B49C